MFNSFSPESSMKVGLITTVNYNIGDDLIRLGIQRVVDQVFAGQTVEYVLAHKHNPYHVPVWHPVRWLPRGRYKAEEILFRLNHFRMDVFDTCDLIVHAGTPVVWPGCHREIWARTMWRTVGKLSARIPVLNLAGGSCFPFTQKPYGLLDPRDVRYIKSILGYCQLTTVRDRIAGEIFREYGAPAPLYPCTAFLSTARESKSEPLRPIVLVNFMEGGGHWDWNQGIDDMQWRATIRAVIRQFSPRVQFRFLCHNQEEYTLAREIDPVLPRLLPQTPEEFFSLVADAHAGICNRIHASIGLASLGVPSVVVGTDTRLFVFEPLGLPLYFVKDVTQNLLAEKIAWMLQHREQERTRLLTLKTATLQRYIALVQESLSTRLSKS